MFDTAKWIWQNIQNNSDEYVKFYDEFSCLGKTVNLNISCDSDYSVWINGRLAGFSQYSDYPHYKVYDEINITDYVKLGLNKLVIVVWYYGGNFSTYLKGNAGLIYEVKENGIVNCCSGKRTLCKIAEDYVSYMQKKITVQLGFSFRYNTELYDGYDKPNFLPENYSSAIEVEGLPTSFYKRPCKRLKMSERTYALPVESRKNLYDLGRETCGFLFIKFKADKGTLLKIAYGEHVNDGGVRDKIGDRNFSVEIVGNGEWFEYINTFRRLGARYLEVSSDNTFLIEYIGICEVYYPVTKMPAIKMGEERKKIYDTSVRTLELCMHLHYEDTPWREQSLYVLDSRNQMLCGYKAFKEYEFAKANLLLISKSHKKGELLPLCFPSERSIFLIPVFSLIYAFSLNEYGKYSGDDAFVKDMLEVLYDIIEFFLERKQPNGLIPAIQEYWNFYEWSEGLTGHELMMGGKKSVRYDIALNCFVVLAMQNVDEIHKRIGFKEKYNKEISTLQSVIRNSFYDEGKGCFMSFLNTFHYSKLCNSLAVLSGSAKGIEDAICQKITSHIGQSMVETTLSMKTFEYDALLQTDKYKYKNYILREIDELYGFMLKNGATSFWETIKGADDFFGAGSLCHGWSALPVYYYSLLAQEEKYKDERIAYVTSTVKGNRQNKGITA